MLVTGSGIATGPRHVAVGRLRVRWFPATGDPPLVPTAHRYRG